MPVQALIASKSAPFEQIRTPHVRRPGHVSRIARLARIAVPEDRLEPLAGELNGIFNWIEQLNEVNVEGVPADDLGGGAEADTAARTWSPTAASPKS